MEFAITYPSRPDAWKDVVIAEDHGFANCWFYDSQMIYSDVYACMALAADHTKRIKLSTGVAIPSNRIEPVTAHSIATINLLAPGRVILGIGSGFTGRYTMGLPRVVERMGPFALVFFHALWETSAVAGELQGPILKSWERYRDEYIPKMKTPESKRYLEMHEGHLKMAPFLHEAGGGEVCHCGPDRHAHAHRAWPRTDRAHQSTRNRRRLTDRDPGSAALRPRNDRRFQPLCDRKVLG
jgi:hypothetical protein